jgi:lipopolysaccharide biosynthesis protein
VYADQNRKVYDVTSINPLAHFIRAGKPAGPWTHEVISPLPFNGMPPEISQLRVALHAHFHYPELFTEFLDVINANRSPCDLLLTTNHHLKAEILENESKAYQRGTVHITVIPNRGRDIGAFLSGLAPATIGHYDVIGHLHSKRSLALADHNIGERWRKFIWQNLIGGQYPMMDIVLDRLSRDAELGLVFPDEPHLSAWDGNLALAQKLACQMGMQEALPPFFDFPIGTMFWARSSALTPLFKLGLTWDDYPKEPAPYDGTILHALERLLPSVAQHVGFRYATTHVPGVTW